MVNSLRIPNSKLQRRIRIWIPRNYMLSITTYTGIIILFLRLMLSSTNNERSLYLYIAGCYFVLFYLRVRHNSERLKLQRDKMRYNWIQEVGAERAFLEFRVCWPKHYVQTYSNVFAACADPNQGKRFAYHPTAFVSFRLGGSNSCSAPCFPSAVPSPSPRPSESTPKSKPRKRKSTLVIGQREKVPITSRRNSDGASE